MSFPLIISTSNDTFYGYCLSRERLSAKGKGERIPSLLLAESNGGAQP